MRLFPLTCTTRQSINLYRHCGCFVLKPKACSKTPIVIPIVISHPRLPFPQPCMVISLAATATRPWNANARKTEYPKLVAKNTNARKNITKDKSYRNFLSPTNRLLAQNGCKKMEPDYGGDRSASALSLFLINLGRILRYEKNPHCVWLP